MGGGCVRGEKGVERRLLGVEKELEDLDGCEWSV